MTDAYTTAAWIGFLTADVSAAGALTGLLFVAVSINLAKILSFPKLPARAAETLAILLLVVVTASLGLVPQSGSLIGVEVIGCTAGLIAVTLAIQLRHGPDRSTDPLWWFLARIAIVQIPAALFLIGGVSLAVGAGGGLYWFVPGTLIAFIAAVYNAWILLVEIVRQHPEDPSARESGPAQH